MRAPIFSLTSLVLLGRFHASSVLQPLAQGQSAAISCQAHGEFRPGGLARHRGAPINAHGGGMLS